MSTDYKRVKQIAAGGLCCLLILGEPAYAGSLNANEQELMSIIRGTYTYHGVTYQVKDEYIQMAADYLAQDSIDTTDEQKQKAINKMYSSIQQGIDEGYLEPVGKESSVKGTVANDEYMSGSGHSITHSENKTFLNADKTVLNSIPETTEAPVKSPQILALEKYADTDNNMNLLEGKTNNGFLPIPTFPGATVRCALFLIVMGTLTGVVAAVRSKLFHYKIRKRGILQ